MNTHLLAAVSLATWQYPDSFNIEAGLLRSVDQFAVFEFLPASGPRFLHGVAAKMTGKSSRCAVIEKNQHRGDAPPMCYPFFMARSKARAESVTMAKNMAKLTRITVRRRSQERYRDTGCPAAPNDRATVR